MIGLGRFTSECLTPRLEKDYQIVESSRISPLIQVPTRVRSRRHTAGQPLGGFSQTGVHIPERKSALAARFKDDGYSAFKEITRDGFGELIGAIERGEIDVVIIRDIDRLTRNLTNWNRFEKACVLHGVLLSPYTGGDLDLSTPEGAYYGGMETLRAKRESAVKSAWVREAADRNARATAAMLRMNSRHSAAACCPCWSSTAATSPRRLPAALLGRLCRGTRRRAAPGPALPDDRQPTRRRHHQPRLSPQRPGDRRPACLRRQAGEWLAWPDRSRAGDSVVWAPLTAAVRCTRVAAEVKAPVLMTARTRAAAFSTA